MSTEALFVQRLMDRGLTRLQAQRWYIFAAGGLQALDRAAAVLATEPRWASLLQKIGTRSLEETDITTELFHIFQELQELAPIDSTLRQYTIGCEVPVQAPNRAGKRSRDADLVLSTLQYQAALRLILESKLLRRVSDVNSAYLGSDGLGCFTCIDSPYTTAHVAAMAAYVRSNSAEAWESELHTRLSASVPTLIMDTGLFPLYDGGRDFLFSDVRRDDLALDPLLLLHRAFLFPA
ncbi:MAG TPA: hypothetical protein VF655_13150 [Allosphingosinicella sp.]|jgi:predicted regulator of Ras-like GTPase activity (Roadblock/LC7/MglB family)